ncbi:MAG: prepilin-type N-terminal cleavage/methylation domain-containing protein [Chromatiales bacterium]
MSTRKQQSGFTLVEIAIVLVIIGLLLGGILKGQELITSARVRNIADQNSGVQAAYYGFVDRYRQIPGDMTGANACAAIGSTNLSGCPGSAPGGNGDGRLDDAGNQFQEASAVWAHLAAAGFINGRYNGGASSEATYVQPLIAPVNAYNGYIALTRSLGYRDPGTATVRLLLFTGRQIPVNVERELDVKVDDGQPLRGVLRAAASGTGALQSDATCVAGAAGSEIWNIDGNSADCGAAFLY